MAFDFRGDPLRGMFALREAMDRLVRESFERLADEPQADEPGTFLIDVAEDNVGYLIYAALPGISPDHLEIQAHGNTIAIRGDRPRDDERHWLVREHVATSFYRVVTLPKEVNADEASAHLEHGVLMITLPKRAEAQPRRIVIGDGATSGAPDVLAAEAIGDVAGLDSSLAFADEAPAAEAVGEIPQDVVDEAPVAELTLAELEAEAIAEIAEPEAVIEASEPEIEVAAVEVVDGTGDLTIDEVTEPEAIEEVAEPTAEAEAIEEIAEPGAEAEAIEEIAELEISALVETTEPEATLAEASTEALPLEEGENSEVSASAETPFLAADSQGDEIDQTGSAAALESGTESGDLALEPGMESGEATTEPGMESGGDVAEPGLELDEATAEPDLDHAEEAAEPTMALDDVAPAPTNGDGTADVEAIADTPEPVDAGFPAEADVEEAPASDGRPEMVETSDKAS